MTQELQINTELYYSTGHTGYTTSYWIYCVTQFIPVTQMNGSETYRKGKHANKRRYNHRQTKYSLQHGLQDTLNFYRRNIESILNGCITAWYSSCTASQRVVKTDQHITKTELPLMEDLYT